jgi:hypothetical protein
VPEEEDRNALMEAPDVFVDNKDVIDDSLPSAGVEISEVVLGCDRFAMTSMVMYHAYISLSAKVFHERDESFLMLAHSVSYLNDTLDLYSIVGHASHDAERNFVQSGR